MRKSLLFLLLASASVPAFAADESDERAARREAARAERAEARAERSEPRGERERPAVIEAFRERVMERREPRVVDVETVEPAPEHRRDVVEPRVHRGPRVVEVEGTREVVEPRERRGPRVVDVDSPSREIEVRDAPASVRNWRRAERGGGAAAPLVQPRTDTGWEPARRHRDQTVEAVRDRIAPIISRTPREGTQPPLHVGSDRSGRTAHRWR